MSQLHKLAVACVNGACNPHGIIHSLAEAISEVPCGACHQSVDLKIIIGQLSFLVGESDGPTPASIRKFNHNHASHLLEFKDH